METSSFPASPHNAAVVIRERIREKRLFEAQFLFGLLDEEDVGQKEYLSLKRELDGLLSVVRDLQLQANKYIADGEPHLAQKMHLEVQRIAIDVPGLPHIPSKIEENTEQPAPIISEEQEEEQISIVEKKQKLKIKNDILVNFIKKIHWPKDLPFSRKRVLVVACSVALLAIISIFFSFAQSEYSDTVLKRAENGGVTIKPLSVRDKDAPKEAKRESTVANAGQMSQSQVSISIGDLQIQPEETATLR